MRYGKWDRIDKTFAGLASTVVLIFLYVAITEIVLPNSESFIKFTLMLAAFVVSVATLGEIVARIDGWLDNDEE